jgi:Ca2+-binding RTX toxin-like protein/uncharacterized protein YaiE (UPF0345 family)
MATQSIFAPTAAPTTTDITDGVGAAGDYALGMEFVSTKAGQINAIRYYKAASETGPHTGKIWSSTGTLLGSVLFANETASGWQEQLLTAPINVAANTTYVISVNVNTHYVATTNGIATTIVNGDLSAVADGSNGVFNEDPGLFPTLSFNNTNYFRDIVFTPAAPNNVGTIALSGTPTQNQLLTATVTDTDGLTGVSIGYQWQQSTDNGATWANIAGAASQTLNLAQAQVGKQVRSIATYIDTLGNTENLTSTATAVVANVNDLGTVAVSGTAATGSVLTATVADLDGLTGATIGYQWQRFANNTWTNVNGAINSTLALDASFVGQQVRVNATYTDALGGSENVQSTASGTVAAVLPKQSVFAATATPAITNQTDGVGANGDYEMGLEFTSAKAGQIDAIRYYKAASETGTHTGNIWSSTGVLLGSVVFANETASGWQEQLLATPITIAANSTYVVSVNANSYYVATSNGLTSTIVNGDLSAVADGSNGVYNADPSLFPTLSFNNTNYFRDIVFAPAQILEASGGLNLAVINNKYVAIDPVTNVVTNLLYNGNPIELGGPNSPFPGGSVIGVEKTADGTGIQYIWKDTNNQFWASTNTDNGAAVPDITTKEAAFKQDFNQDGFLSLLGTTGDDTLIGGSGADLIVGDAGNDSLDGGAGNDLLYGKAGNDTINGGDGNDYMNGGSGNNTLNGGAGNDTFINLADGLDSMAGGTGDDLYIVYNSGSTITELSGEGTDTVVAYTNYTLADNVENLYLVDSANGNGNSGDNTIITYGTGNNTIKAGAGNDYVDGGAGDDLLYGNEGNDYINGGDGNDYINGGAGTNTLNGGAGNDTFINLADGLDRMAGGTGDDLYVVYNSGSTITELGGEGNDSVVAYTNYALADNVETLYLIDSANGTGNSSNNTIITYGTGNNIIEAGAGNDYVDGGDGNDLLYGNDGNDYINGGVGNDYFNGGAGSDTLNGGAGNDTFISVDSGTDVLSGGAGDDFYYTSNNTTIVVENANEGNDAVWATVNFTLTANIETLYLDGSVNGTGNAGNNTIVGYGNGNNVINGLGGNDVLIGGAGADTFAFGGPALTTVSQIGIDRVQDFSKAEGDRLFFSNATFAALAPSADGFIASSDLLVVANDAAINNTVSAKIIYSTGSGNLFYNENGAAAGFGAAGGQFATLDTKPSLTRTDILVAIAPVV